MIENSADMTGDFSKGGKYFEIHKKIFQFHKKHAGTQTDEQWQSVVDELSKFTDVYAIRMAAVVIAEIEKDCLIKRYGEEIEAELLRLEQKLAFDIYKLIRGMNAIDFNGQQVLEQQ